MWCTQNKKPWYVASCYRVLRTNSVLHTDVKRRTLHSKHDEGESHTNNNQIKRCQKIRRNALNIQMLSESLYRQIFKQPSSELSGVSEDDLKKIRKHLERFDLWNKQTTALPDLDFKLPELKGSGF